MMNNGVQCSVTLIAGNERSKIECDPGTLLFEVLIQKGARISAPCGGHGLCGKCKVIAEGGGLSELSADEVQRLTPYEIKQGLRLACSARVTGHAEIKLTGMEGQAHILTSGLNYSVELSPLVRKEIVRLTPPSLQDQQDDSQRLFEALKIKNAYIPADVLRMLPGTLRRDGFRISATVSDDEIIAVDDVKDISNFGIAVDIGTTTVACYLVDLVTGKQRDVMSGLNAQKPYGDDVISRISCSMENKDGLTRLQKAIVSQINDLVSELLQRNGLDMNELSCMSIAGNTTMMHLFAGVSPEAISVSPFTPAFTQAAVEKPNKLGLDLPESSRVLLMPSISGYVGADIVGGILSSGMHQSEELCLLLDIGTNGEIALGNKDRILCCSAAAGPAFEGAHIRHGVGGIDGAINAVGLKENQIVYSTLAGKRPIGICGSGIIDSAAMLLNLGIIDETGRFADDDELPENIEGLKDRIKTVNGAKAFVLANSDETANGSPIYITQKDIREIQLAKAAIAAGINTLVKSLGIELESIGKVYLAGGFGSYMDKKSAARLGLLPAILEERIQVVGNAAGTGAVMALLSRDCRDVCNKIREKAEYIELSAVPGFQDVLVDCMFFE